MKLKLRPDKIDADWLRDPERIRRARVVEQIRKHAAPIHPGTGTDQSVHGGGGGGTALLDRPDEVFPWRFTRIDDHDPAWDEFEAQVEQQNADLYSREFDINGDSRTLAEWRDYFNFSEDTPPRKVISHLKNRGDIGDVIIPPPISAPPGYGMKGKFYGPGLDPLDLGPTEALAHTKEIGAHIDSGYDLIESRVHELTVADIKERAHTDAAFENAMKKHYGTTFRRHYDNYLRTDEGSRLQMEITRAQGRAGEAALLALPALNERGRTLHGEVEDYAESQASTLGSDYDGAKWRMFSDDEIQKINAEHPDLAKAYDKVLKARDRSAETSQVYTKFYNRRTEGLSPSRFIEDSVRGVNEGSDSRRTLGKHYYALPKDLLKKDSEGFYTRFKNYRDALKDDSLHTSHRTLMYEPRPTDMVTQWEWNMDQERSFRQEFQAEMGDDFVVMSGGDYSRMYGHAEDSASSASKRAWTRADNLTEEWSKLAKAKVHTSRIDVVRDGFERAGIPMGGDVTTTHKGKTKGGTTLKAGQPYLPTKWIERSNDNGPLTLNFRSNARAHYLHRENEMMVDGSLHSTLHEFGHRIEHIDPVINAFESAFYKHRTGEQELVRLKDLPDHGHYPSEEFSKPDAFHTPYTGKRYGYGRMVATTSGHVASNTAYELISTGYSDIVMSGKWEADRSFKVDDEERNFYYGLIDITARP